MSVDRDRLGQWLCERIAGLIDVPVAAVDRHTPLHSLGLGSRDAVALAADLEATFAVQVNATIAYDYPTVSQIVQAICQDTGGPALSRPAVSAEPIAIVGIGCRFPGAGAGPARFWAMLSAGEAGIGEIPPDRWNTDDRYGGDQAGDGQSCTRWAGLIDGIADFDPAFFHIPPVEARTMDPQQRLVLEACHHAIEDAGLATADLGGSATGVYVGISQSEYASRQIRAGAIGALTPTGGALSISANRVSYVFDLHGPSMALDSACSSSLLAVHTACAALTAGDCTLALAGGVNVILSDDLSVAFTAAGLMSPDGRCHAFDDRANGYVRGEGVGMVLLERLSVARANRRRIYAVIKGSAVVQDGRSNGLMAPRGLAQQQVIAAACSAAGVDPGDIGYVEAHGTGTAIGDAIEAEALGATVGRRRGGAACRIGSVKSNIGHLESAAGIAGLIKTALCLQARQLVPHHDFRLPNSQVDFAARGLEVVTLGEAWPASPGAPLAGVSSFGFGGTNVHAILEAAPTPVVDERSGGSALLSLSANSREALADYADAYATALAGGEPPHVRLGWVDASLYRDRHAYRLNVVGADAADLARQVRARLAQAPAGTHAAAGKPINFVYSGQGTIWPGAGQALFRESAIFQAALLECDDALRAWSGRSILPALFGPQGEALLTRTEHAQPAIFACQVALTALLRSWGIIPAAVLGHSVGEVAAAWAAGALSLRDAARVVTVRAASMAGLAGQGAMLLLRGDEREAAAIIAAAGGRLDIAAVNGPESIVIAGPIAAIDAAAAAAAERSVDSYKLDVDYAFHSSQMEEAGGRVEAELSDLRPMTPDTPFFSGVDGGSAATALDARYWRRNVRAPVLFASAVTAMADGREAAWLEVGTHPVLRRDIAASAPAGALFVSTLRRNGDAWRDMHHAAAALQEAGAIDDLSGLAATGGALGAPPYTWSKQRYWHDAETDGDGNSGDRMPSSTARRGFMGARIDVAGSAGIGVWTGTVDFPADRYLLDHSIFGFALMPAAAWIDIAMGIAADLEGPRATVRHIRFIDALLLSEDRPLHLQAVASRADGTTRIEMYSRLASGGDEWRLHATAELGDADDDRETASIDRIRSRCFDQYPAGIFYRLLDQRGMNYGTAFQRLREVCGTRGEALGALQIEGAECGGHRLHPALLDGALQAAAAAFGAKRFSDPAASGMIPVGSELVAIYRDDAVPCWSHVTAVPDRGDGLSRVDVDLLDGDGRLAARVAGLALKGASAAAGADLKVQHGLGRWLYETTWQPWEPPAATVGPPPMPVLAIVGEEPASLAALVTALNDRGTRAIGVMVGAIPGRAPDDLAGAAAWDAVAATVAASGIDVAVVVAMPGDGPMAAADIAELVRSMNDGSLAGSPRLVLLTRGAAMVGGQLRTEHAGMFGLQRAILIEHPDLDCCSLDLAPDAAGTEDAEALTAIVRAGAGEAHVAMRQGAYYVARLGRRRVSSVPPSVEAARRYLVTGGCGALGEQAARGLLELGARDLVLVGRRADPDPGALTRIRGVAPDAELSYIACDLADREAVAALIATVNADGALAGIVHAAGVLDDGSIQGLDARRFLNVMGPKALGACWLDDAIGDHPLDFFVLFSSAAATLGSPGQASYCAANAYLDGLARARSQAGKPSLSLAWGAWAGGGMAANSSIGQSGLIDAIDPDIGRGIFKRLLGETGQVMVLPANLAALAQFYPSHGGLSLLADVVGAALRETRSGRGEEKLYDRPDIGIEYVAPSTEIEHAIINMWQRAIGMTGIGVRDELFALGGDSVFASQILGLVNKTYGIRIEPDEAYQLFTVEKLAAAVERHLLRYVEGLDDESVENLLVDAEQS